MAEPAAAPASSSANGTSGGLMSNKSSGGEASPPAPVTQGPPPGSNSSPLPVSSTPPPSTIPPISQSPPSPVSKSPPSSMSPPPPNSPPPNPPPLSPPPGESFSSPTPPKSISPPPSPPQNQHPSASPPPPSPLPHDLVPPPIPLSPPNAYKQSPPPPNSPSPIFSPPPLPTPVIVPPPPNSSFPSLSPPVQMTMPLVPETPSGIPLSPPLPMSPPKPLASPTNSTNQTIFKDPSPSSSSNSAPNVTPSSRHVDSSSSTPSSSGSSHSVGSSGTVTVAVVVGVVLAVAIVAFAAIFFWFSTKKKRRMNGLAGQYRPTLVNFSIAPDGQYHRQANTEGNSSSSDSYYPTKTPSSPSAIGNSYGSYRSHMYQSGFTYEELMDITNGFSQKNAIGEGGFGCVYQGCLPDGRTVAVKQLKAGSGQGEREFRSEVEIISRVHHRHLVSLVGYCISENHRLLVYEFVPNKTLEYHLHGKGLPAMEWPKRVKIAIGSARGLAYLHEDCHPRIIHRDIKSANILLDDSFEAQVADFGLAKLTNDAVTHVSTRVMGTFGYMAPEYASSGKLTDRSDVFSFGVVLLELITGRKPVDPSRPLGDESLVEWARPLLVRALEVGDYEELVDPRLENNFVQTEMLRMIEVATACVRHSAPKRPRMVQVLRTLDSHGDLADLSNGVKFGQSVVYDSSQYSIDIQKFRKMAFGSEELGYESVYSGSTYSSESQSKEGLYSHLDPGGNKELSSSEYESTYGLENRTTSGRCSTSSDRSHHYNGRGCP